MLVYDGECGFCERAVRFVLAHERRKDLLFVPRNSQLGLSLRERFGLQQVESLLWIEDQQACTEWNAVAHLAGYIGGVYGWLAKAAGLLPDFILSAGYRWIAQIRKRLAGPPRHCLVPSAEQRVRFLE